MQHWYVFRLDNGSPSSSLRWGIISALINKTLVDRSLMYQALSTSPSLCGWDLVFPRSYRRSARWLINSLTLFVSLCWGIKIGLRHIFAWALWVNLLLYATRTHWWMSATKLRQENSSLEVSYLKKCILHLSLSILKVGLKRGWFVELRDRK